MRCIRAAKLALSDFHGLAAWKFSLLERIFLTKICNIWSELPGIRTLSLTRNQITDAGLPHLHGLAALERLQLDEIAITNAGLEAKLADSRIKYLSVRSSKITDEGLRHLTTLNSVVEISIHSPHVTEAGLAQFSRLPSLRRLSINLTRERQNEIPVLNRALPKVEINR